LLIANLSKTLLETSISFSIPHLQQNHVSPNVGSVHWLAPPDFQCAINQQCDGEVSSPEHAIVEGQAIAHNHLHLLQKQLQMH
jgi:hypothetical protein